MALTSSSLLFYFLCLNAILYSAKSAETSKSKVFGNTADIQFSINADQDGFYNVSINSVVYLKSADTFFIVGGKTYQQADLHVNKREKGARSDQLGNYNYTLYSYRVSPENVTIETWIKDYTPSRPIITFDVVYVNTVNGTRSSNCPINPFPPTRAFHTCFNETIFGFPTFQVTNSSEKLGFLTFGGKFMGWHSMQMAEFGSLTPKITDGIRGGVPLAIFNEQGNTVIVSPQDNFMASSMWHKNPPGGSVNWGIMGGIENIPAGRTFRTIIVASSGINKAFDLYGNVMRSWYRTDINRKDVKKNDMTIHNLGYWTDNGAYYYYNTESNKTYHDTLTDVSHDAKVVTKIPYKYMQLDSWWYYKGIQGSVKEWSARPDIFPNGLTSLQRDTSYPFAAHNRYWGSDNVYAKQNNGSYDFIKEPFLALPNSKKFWLDLFAKGKEWKLIMYEQDWLNIQTLYLAALQTDLDLGNDWLDEMGTAALEYSISVQYCMALPRHALQSLSIPAVTQIRVSEDYHLYKEQWRIGITSIFADALGLVPFKDTFWTTSVQSGNPKYPHKTEPNPRLQAVISTLSTGPVGPGDELNKTDVNLLMKCCNAEGLILKPSKPAKAIDRQIIKHALPNTNGPVGEIWTTYTTITSDTERSFGILFAANLSAPFTVHWDDLRFPDTLQNSLVFPYSNPTEWQTFNGSLTLTNCTSDDICLYYFSAWEPGLNGTNIAIFGEVNKWVPMSPQRVSNIIHAENNMVVQVKGKPGETVTMYFLQENSLRQVTCQLNGKGTANVNMYSGCFPPRHSTTTTLHTPERPTSHATDTPTSERPTSYTTDAPTLSTTKTTSHTTNTPPNSGHVMEFANYLIVSFMTCVFMLNF